MKHSSSQSGFAPAVLIAAIAVVVLGVSGLLVFMNQAGEPSSPRPSERPRASSLPTTSTVPSGTAAPLQGTSPSLAEDPGAPSAPAPITYRGAVLAGTSAPLLEFVPEDLEKAKASGKLVVLYFYANWCPNCIAEFPLMQAAFNELTTDRVVGFRVNYNDNETTAEEVALAREHGVAYQHTKVFVQNDTQLLKSPEAWTKDRYLSEIARIGAR